MNASRARKNKEVMGVTLRTLGQGLEDKDITHTQKKFKSSVTVKQKVSKIRE